MPLRFTGKKKITVYSFLYTHFFFKQGKKIYLVIVFRQLLKATNYGKCAKTEIQHLSIVLPDVIENLHKSCNTSPHLPSSHSVAHKAAINHANLSTYCFIAPGET